MAFKPSLLVSNPTKQQQQQSLHMKMDKHHSVLSWSRYRYVIFILLLWIFSNLTLVYTLIQKLGKQNKQGLDLSTATSSLWSCYFSWRVNTTFPHLHSSQNFHGSHWFKWKSCLIFWFLVIKHKDLWFYFHMSSFKERLLIHNYLEGKWSKRKIAGRIMNSDNTNSFFCMGT